MLGGASTFDSVGDACGQGNLAIYSGDGSTHSASAVDALLVGTDQINAFVEVIGRAG